MITDSTTFSLQAYVEAENSYGIGDFSVRVVFRTAKASSELEGEEGGISADALNKTRCCIAAGVQAQCELQDNYRAQITGNLLNELDLKDPPRSFSVIR